MQFVDRQRPAMRDLIYEFGLEQVRGMMADGWVDPVTLRPELVKWRERMRQQAPVWPWQVPQQPTYTSDNTGNATSNPWG